MVSPSESVHSCAGPEGSRRKRGEEIIQCTTHLRYLRDFIRHERADLAGVDPGSAQRPAVPAAEQAVGVGADRRLGRSAGKRQRIEPALQHHIAGRWSRPKLPDSAPLRRSDAGSGRRLRSECRTTPSPEIWRSPAGWQRRQRPSPAPAWLPGQRAGRSGQGQHDDRAREQRSTHGADLWPSTPPA